MQDFTKYKYQRRNMIWKERLNRIGLVLGVLFLIAFWLPKPIQNQKVEAQTTIVSGKFGTVEKEQVLPTATPITTPKPTPKPKTNEQKISEFLKWYGSPLSGYTKTFIKYAEKYKVDPKIMVAISVTESSAGKNLCHGEKDGHNAFGLLYRKRWSNNKITRECIEFGSYDQSIEYLAKLLGTTYKSNGKKSIAQIGSSYDPGNPTWIQTTQKYYNQINEK